MQKKPDDSGKGLKRKVEHQTTSLGALISKEDRTILGTAR